MKKNLLILIIFSLVFIVTSCKNDSITSTEESNDEEIEQIYTIYNGEDEVVSETKNMWTAILNAGRMSKNSDRHYVVDYENNEVFRYSNVKYYKYLGDTYYGETKD